MKFIHIADVHLGVKPDQGKPWSELRARQIWDSFAEVTGVAKREKPEFLFVTGGSFPRTAAEKGGAGVSRLFGEIPDTQVLLIAGNHDYLREKSYYLSDLWPDNVTVFKKEEAEAVDFPEYNTTIYGLSYWHREIHDRLYDELRPVNRSRCNILLAHGGDERHIPFSAERILQNGFDYIAAGHIHRSGWLMPHKAVMARELERQMQRHRAARILDGNVRGTAGQMYIFIRCATANIVMRRIRQTGTRQTVCCGTGQRSCWSRDRSISISVCISKGKKSGVFL